MERRSPSRPYQQSILCGCLLFGLTLGGCGDDDSPSSGNGGVSGSISSGGSLGNGASAGEPSNSAGESTSVGGAAGARQEPDVGGAAGADGGGADGGGTGGNGAVGGANVGGGAGTGLYLPCASQADCQMYGGGKVCCAVASMQFCTKQSACPGDTLP
ncbi:MAG TPA: hypothetical protein VIW29_10660 [Polyangiaceae bacterium]